MTIAHRWRGTDGNDEFVFNDRVIAAVDFVFAGQGDDFISDGRSYPWSNDAFYGQKGNDHLVSYSGNDSLFGGKGIDFFEVTAGTFKVRVSGNDGFDVLVIENSEGCRTTEFENMTVIETSDGGTIIARGVEEIFLL